ncbi:MAG: winged helix-turn-helix domain-containing protein [Desulfobacca sp.]|uniref:winged helix-turn-helix domain-containing protein n=1 Tax=Desulfobacca sp. TaxID=2067990 RepID=UPI0040493CCC
MAGITIQCKIWLEKNGEVFFGRGRLRLLQGIATYGSLAEAARHLGMSYRAAWGRLKTSETRLGRKLTEKVPAAGRGQRLVLTPLGHALVADFLALEDRLAQFLVTQQQTLDDKLAS